MDGNFNKYLHLCNVHNVPIPKYRKRQYKERLDHFSLSESEFKKRYRLSKSTAEYLISLVGTKIQANTSKNRALTPSDMVLLTLRFFSCGNFLITVADYCGVSVASASRVVTKVSVAIAKLSDTFIYMPTTNVEIMKTASEFYTLARFPKVIGAIDGTHVKIESPGGTDAEIYRNRKGYFSFNVQAVCNANMEIIDIVARWPGSAHDSNILNNSRIKTKFENNLFKDYVLLGDSGYGCKSYLLTPLSDPKSEAEMLYNESQIRTRNVVERTFGVWKRRFPVLSLGLRLSTKRIMNVIIACAVLHNMCRFQNDVLDDDEEDDFDDKDSSDESFHCEDTNCNTRSSLINNYFSKL